MGTIQPFTGTFLDTSKSRVNSLTLSPQSEKPGNRRLQVCSRSTGRGTVKLGRQQNVAVGGCSRA